MKFLYSFNEVTIQAKLLNSMDIFCLLSKYIPKDKIEKVILDNYVFSRSAIYHHGLMEIGWKRQFSQD